MDGLISKKDNFDEPKREWKLIPEALERMPDDPDDAVRPLCKLKGYLISQGMADREFASFSIRSLATRSGNSN